MKGGTYAEAIKAGFTEEQAGMLGRFGAEMKSEVIDYLKTEGMQKVKAGRSEFKSGFQYGAVFALIAIAILEWAVGGRV